MIDDMIQGYLDSENIILYITDEIIIYFKNNTIYCHTYEIVQTRNIVTIHDSICSVATIHSYIDGVLEKNSISDENLQFRQYKSKHNVIILYYKFSAKKYVVYIFDITSMKLSSFVKNVCYNDTVHEYDNKLFENTVIIDHSNNKRYLSVTIECKAVKMYIIHCFIRNFDGSYGIKRIKNCILLESAKQHNAVYNKVTGIVCIFNDNYSKKLFETSATLIKYSNGKYTFKKLNLINDTIVIFSICSQKIDDDYKSKCCQIL